MKIRKGYVSNSSSSCFIISNKYKSDDIRKFCKDLFIKRTKNNIEELKKSNHSYISNKEEYVKMLENDITNIDKNIEIYKVSECPFDLSEWFDMSELKFDDLVLTDCEDNILNWLGNKIIKQYNVELYCLHM